MGLENRLKDLALYYGRPLGDVVKSYEARLNALMHAHGRDYVGRESRLKLYAYKGTEMMLKYKVGKSD